MSQSHSRPGSTPAMGCTSQLGGGGQKAARLRDSRKDGGGERAEPRREERGGGQEREGVTWLGLAAPCHGHPRCSSRRPGPQPPSHCTICPGQSWALRRRENWGTHRKRRVALPVLSHPVSRACGRGPQRTGAGVCSGHGADWSLRVEEAFQA